MYSATFGMLWSVCTNTFIPFLSVFVATGNSACPQTGPPIKSEANNTKATLLVHPVFISHPSPQPRTILKTQNPVKMFNLPSQAHQLFTFELLNSSTFPLQPTQTPSPLPPTHPPTWSPPSTKTLPPPALRLNPKDSRADTNPHLAPNGVPQNPRTPRNPHSRCRIQFRSPYVRSIPSPLPPKAPENASSPAHPGSDTSAHPATAKPIQSSEAQSTPPKSARAFSPILRRARPAPDSRHPSRLPR